MYRVRENGTFRDPIDSRPDHLVFNRIVPLRDSWAAEAQKQAPAAASTPQKPPEPKAPKTQEAKAPEPLSPEEQELLERLRPSLLPVVDAVLAAQPNEVERYRNGQTGVLGFLLAQVMKRSAGEKPNPKLVNALLRERLG